MAVGFARRWSGQLSVPRVGTVLQLNSFMRKEAFPWPDTLQSVHQALRILTLLRTRDELGVSEIAAQLGIGSF